MSEYSNRWVLAGTQTVDQDFGKENRFDLL
jgi:hypothetical protein